MDTTTTLKLLGLVMTLAALPISYVWVRSDGSGTHHRYTALVAITVFLTFDLIVFGAFTRLSDSGLGCPDWPGCYGQASPFGALQQINAAQAALPSGPVTTSKAWIEMIHRYLAMVVGALILTMTVFAWRRRATSKVSPWWPSCTLVWVIVQGLFGKYTVTLKLYPAVVTLHLLGGLVLLALLVQQREAALYRPLALGRSQLRWLKVCIALLAIQVALGGWVSSNYAVLACSGFPQCNGSWWPEMDLNRGFTFLRGLGEAGANGYVTHAALVAIHMAHRLSAAALSVALLALMLQLWRSHNASLGNYAKLLGLLLVAQLATGLSTVVLGWPLLAALGHSAGAAGFVFVLATLLARCAGAANSTPNPQPAATSTTALPA